MQRYYKIVLWSLGCIILWLLIQLPLQQVLPNYKAIPQPFAGQTIVLDPGHGGPDGGAKGSNDLDEKNITLEIAKLIRNYLEQAGAVVYLTREDDRDLASKDTKGLSRRKSEDIRNRLAFIQEKEADLFLTIHLNAIPNPRWSGSQTFFYPSFPENKLLAESIQTELIANMKNTDRTPLQIDTVYLLKHAEVPGALVELGFLSNEQERALLEKTSYQKKLAASVYQGMLQFTLEEGK